MPRTRPSELASRIVGAEIGRARGKRRLTQTELAERMGATRSYIAHVEKGNKNLTVGQLAAIAGALDAGLSIEFKMPRRARVTVPDTTVTR